MHKQKRFNDNQILAAGFVLIILVIIFTLFREKLFPKSDWIQKSNSSIASPKQNEEQKYPTTSATELNKKINLRKENFTLLDIRPFEAYIAQHILDAVNVPLDEFPVGSKIDGHTLVIIIGSNKDDKNIDKAVEKLKEEKIENFKVLAGGMESWNQLIGATVTYGDPKSFVDQSKVAYLDANTLHEAFKAKAPVYIVDVRTNEDFAKGHIAGAINIPIDELEKRRSEIKEKKIIVVGINELQEFQAAVQMYDILLASPYVMRGAMPKWEELKFELAK